MQASTENLPWVVRHLTWPWHRRHPRLVVVTEALVAAWMVFLGIALCSIGDWAGALLFLAAGLLLWFLRVFWRSLHWSQ